MMVEFRVSTVFLARLSDADVVLRCCGRQGPSSARMPRMTICATPYGAFLDSVRTAPKPGTANGSEVYRATTATFGAPFATGLSKSLEVRCSRREYWR